MNTTTRAAESYQVEHFEALNALRALDKDPGRPAWLAMWDEPAADDE